MRFRAKRRIALAVVGFLAVWPLVHHATVRALDLNPWNWFGWAMYTTPPASFRFRVAGLDGRPVPFHRLPPEARALVDDEYRRFRELRREFGERVEPRRWARTILALFRDLDGVRIRVEQRRVNPATAKLERYRVSQEPYVYRRSDFGL